MTLNQIQYQNMLETRRSNLEKERQGRDTISETARHNMADEGIRQQTVDVNRRHYDNQDAIASSQLAESIYHNRVSEGETARHNTATESLQARGTEVNLTTGLVSAAARSKNPVVSGTLLAAAGAGTEVGKETIVNVGDTAISGVSKAYDKVGRPIGQVARDFGKKAADYFSHVFVPTPNYGGNS